MTPETVLWTGSLLAVGLASAIPLSATVALAQRPAVAARWVPRLVFLAAGALLGAAVFHLLPESRAFAPPGVVAGMTLVGFVAFAALERLLHRHDHGDGLVAPPTQGLVAATIAGDALHNAIDGVLVATAFLAEPSLGVMTGAAIALHELPRELGTFAVCVRGGMSPRRAILVNIGTGVLAIASAIAALVVGTRARAAAGYLMPFAAGNFLFLGIAILAAERQGMRGSAGRRNALLVAAGIALAAAIGRH